MCGFVAIISRKETPETTLTIMRDRLFHRGPDGGKNMLFKRNDTHIALGQRWLSIQDLRDVAMLPMQSEDGKYTIVYNGEIYNFIELRKTLEGKGHKFRTKSDSEVLLHAYMEWGEECIGRLKGMFTFFIWDERNECAFIARDRFGQKPLYFTCLENQFIAFASEIKALVAHPHLVCAPNIQQVGEVMAGKFIDGQPESLFEGIERFMPAHCMKINKQGKIVKYFRYWKPNYEVDRTIQYKDAMGQLRELLSRSIEHHTRADVSGSACLSGGLDSSTIVGYLSKNNTLQNNFELKETLSVCFPDDLTMDESEYINLVTKKVQIPNTKIEPHADELLQEMAKFHWHYEGPIPSTSMYLEWCVMKKAKQLGYKVMLDGQGADELFAGYSYYFQYFQQDAYLLKKWNALLSNIPFQEARLYKSSQKYKNYERRFSRKFYLPRRELERLGEQLLIDENRYAGMQGLPIAKPGNCFRYALASYLLYDSLPIQLRSGDCNAMAHSVETRFPYLDYDLVDWCTKLPDEYLICFGWQKYILRKAARGVLPHKVRWRVDKMGFQSPQDIWMKSHLKEWWLEHIESPLLADIPGHDKEKLQNLFRSHSNSPGEKFDTLWQWASLAEWLTLFQDGTWRNGWHEKNPSHRIQEVSLRTNAEHPKLPIKDEDVSYSRIEHLKIFGRAAYHWSPSIRKAYLFLRSIYVNTYLFLRSIYLFFQKPEVLENKNQPTFIVGTKAVKRKKTVWIISFTPVSQEPRVLRQAEAFLEEGWTVVVLGYDGSSKVPDEWFYIRLPLQQRYSKFYDFFLRCKRAIGRRACLYLKTKFIASLGAQMHVNNIANWRYIREAIIQMAKVNKEFQPNLVICHDYFTCKAGYDLAQYAKARFVIDCHEYATGQYAHDAEWMKNYRPWIFALQDYYLKKADKVTTVCDGIARLLTQEHELKEPVITIRSVPFFSQQKFRPTGESINVLYHGDISYIRGLHKAIKSMTLWRPEFTLTIRGSGTKEYIDDILELAKLHKVENRVFIEPPVPFNKIVPEANKSDIGYFVHKDTSPQKKFVLPNKFFEYTMAGLALCVSDLPEMAKIVQKYNSGVLVSSYNEEKIAEAINSLTKVKIDEYKRASLKAAKELNWQKEKQRMLKAYSTFL